jgi:hypothetical protein
MFTTVDIPGFVYADQARRGSVVEVVAQVLPSLPTQKPQVIAHVDTPVGGGFGEILPMDARRDLVVLAALFIGLFVGSLIW